MAIKTNGGVVQIVGVRELREDRSGRARSGDRGAAAGVRAAERTRRRRRRAAARRRRRRRRRARLKARRRAGAGRGGRGGRGGATAGVETLPADRRAEFERRLAEIDRKWPAAGRAPR